MPPVNRILVIDDETAIQESLEMFLREKGLEVFTAGTGAAGLDTYARYRPQVVILDIRLPDISGLEILNHIVGTDPEAKVIMITAYHDMETTIEAMRQGAYDYIHKPIDVDELDRSVTKSLRIAETAYDTAALSTNDRETGERLRIVGHTPSMRAVFKTIGLLSRNRATVLIEGETGCGKELIARVIHESSIFCEQPYVTVDCTTLVDNLFESELFGHERGAFTGAGETKRGRLELAGEGTIFFDEVGDLPLPLQAKLLRFLEYREFTRVGGTQTLHSKARIIAATNHKLADLVSQSHFRQDLLFRLNVITISVPPLRERLDDLPELVRYFLSRINSDLGTKVTRLEKNVMARAESPLLARQRARTQECPHQGGPGIPRVGFVRRCGGNRACEVLRRMLLPLSRWPLWMSWRKPISSESCGRPAAMCPRQRSCWDCHAPPSAND